MGLGRKTNGRTVHASYSSSMFFSFALFLNNFPSFIYKGIWFRNLAEDTVMMRSFMEMIPDCRHLWLRCIQLERQSSKICRELQLWESASLAPIFKASQPTTLGMVAGCQTPQQAFSSCDNWSLNKPAFKNSCSAGLNIWGKKINVETFREGGSGEERQDISHQKHFTKLNPKA